MRTPSVNRSETDIAGLEIDYFERERGSCRFVSSVSIFSLAAQLVFILLRYFERDAREKDIANLCLTVFIPFSYIKSNFEVDASYLFSRTVKQGSKFYGTIQVLKQLFEMLVMCI